MEVNQATVDNVEVPQNPQFLPLPTMQLGH